MDQATIDKWQRQDELLAEGIKKRDKLLQVLEKLRDEIKERQKQCDHRKPDGSNALVYASVWRHCPLCGYGDM